MPDALNKLHGLLDEHAALEQEGLAALARGDMEAFAEINRRIAAKKNSELRGVHEVLVAHPELRPGGYDLDEEAAYLADLEKDEG